MGLADLLISATADRDDSPGLTEEQQITRLTEFHAQVYAVEPERFEPGQIVWLKCGNAHPFEHTEAPRLFVGYLDAPVRGVDLEEDITTFAAALVLDCRTLVMFGGQVLEHLSDSRHFTRRAPR